ncbi:hypothetical protein BOX15_Mlig028470g2, partial [Macrostomum lignano]
SAAMPTLLTSSSMMSTMQRIRPLLQLRHLSSERYSYWRGFLDRLATEANALTTESSASGKQATTADSYLLPESRDLARKARPMQNGGLLPRLKDPRHEAPVVMPPYQPIDDWHPKQALFGQNDYIDILGEGEVTPKDLYVGPNYTRLSRGSEFLRNFRRLSVQDEYMKEFMPTRRSIIQLNNYNSLKYRNKRRNNVFPKYREEP